MIKNFLQFINERLGVPEGNIESAEMLYDFLIKELSQNKDKSVKENIHFKFNDEISISDLEINNVDIKFENFIDKNVEIDIIGMSVNTDFKMDDLKVVYKQDSFKKTKIDIRFLCNEENTYENILEYFISSKSFLVGILAHELKHIYDKYKIGKTTFADAAEYSIWTKNRTGIDAIDSFIFYLYLTSKQENLVRSSEVSAQLKSSDIKKSEFLDFLKSTTIFNRIKEMRKFSYENMKIELNNDTEKIKKILEENGIDIPSSDKELVETILEVTYRYIVGSQINTIENMIYLHPVRKALGLLKEEELEYFNKFIKKVTFKNYEDFFLFWEKRIIFESNKVLKKISKLYDMCED